MAMGYTDTARIKGLLRVAVGTGADERLSSAIALMDGEDENDMAAEPDEAERAAALAAGAAIGATGRPRPHKGRIHIAEVVEC